MEVLSDVKVLEKEYPCLAAVNRCANCRIILLFFLISDYCCTQQRFILMLKCLVHPIAPSSSHRRTSPPGQGDQAAVLRRGADPEDAHVGGKGERTLTVVGLH